MTEDVADTGLPKRRETQRERVARALVPYTENHIAATDAAIAAHADPRVLKERAAPPNPTDYCRLHAMRHEFASLVAFIEANAANGAAPGIIQALDLARALREQGVVIGAEVLREGAAR